MSKNRDNYKLRLAVVGLFVNVFFLPGLGSIISGKNEEGAWQLGLFIGGPIIGIILSTSVFAFIALPVMVASLITAWTLGVITSFKMLQESK